MATKTLLNLHNLLPAPKGPEQNPPQSFRRLPGKFAANGSRCIKLSLETPIDPKRLYLVLTEWRRNFVSTHGTDGPFSNFCVVLVYEETLWACRTVPGGGAPKRGADETVSCTGGFCVVFWNWHGARAASGGRRGRRSFEFGWRRWRRGWWRRRRRFGGRRRHASCSVGSSS